MTITVEIPDSLAGQIGAEGQDPTRAVLEALALEGYRSERLSLSAVRDLLGFDILMEADAFLKEHGVFLHYTVEDLQHDIEMARTVADRAQIERHDDSPTERLAG